MHIPVMKDEVIKYLNIINNGIYIDCTFGNGGHSKAILNKLNNNGKLLILDKDIKSINIAKKIVDNRILINHLSFSKLKKNLNKNIIGKVNGILLDLGLSTNQILDNNRGFSFSYNGILDMRINVKEGIPAFKWIQNATYKEIKYVFNKFGEEYKYSDKIAKYIVFINKKKPIKTTYDLVQIITKFHKKNKKIHPATKYFQAIRIYINDELNEIKFFLKDVIDILDLNGRLLIICFNSLENRIVKNFFNFKNTFINNIPLTYNEEKKLLYKNNNYYMKKIIKLKPTKNEINYNYKSRSAILTVFEKKYL